MNIKLATVFALLLCLLRTSAQIPPGYYDPAAGLNGQALQAALHNIIKDHDAVSYSSLISWFESTDKKPDNSVWDMYSDVPGGTPPYVYYFGSGDECGNYNSEGDCFNREHSWPKSWFGGEVMPMYSDLFHLYPTDGYVNNKRDNYPYGEVGPAQWISQNGSRLGSCTWPGYSGVVFEPVDEYKGDLARSYFYMSVRYYTEDNTWPGSPMTDGSQLKPWALDMMMHWNEQDPVSEKEIDRNNAVYLIQDNRNPFIDHPEFASSIWGTATGFSFSEGERRITIFPNPAGDHFYILLPASSTKEKFWISVYDLVGRSVDCPHDSGSGKIRIDGSGLPSGIYLVLIRNESGNVTGTGSVIKR